MNACSKEPAPTSGTHRGLAYARFGPAGRRVGSVLILHGAGSCKENHYDFARVCQAQRLEALVVDLRGHGESTGALDGRVLDDLAALAELAARPLGLRGSSMGGYLALLAAGPLDARAVVAICPAGPEHLLEGVRDGELEFRADRLELARFLARHPLAPALHDTPAAVLLLHAEGDERIPVAHSEQLRAAVRGGASLVRVPGGDHRSVQHDPAFQALAARFLALALGAGNAA